MPYAKEKQRAYQNEWIKRRRLDWLSDNGPCANCGSWNDLQVDHKDPAQKVTHRIWSWSKDRREKELAKCQPLCGDCHKEKTYDQRFGESGPWTGWKCRCRVCRGARAVRKRLFRRQILPQPCREPNASSRPEKPPL